MKILLISPTQSGIGGTAKHVQGLTNYLESKNHFVKIISSDNTFTIPIKKLKNPSFMLSSLLKTKFSGNYDLLNDEIRNYKIGYSYFDECFGINLDFDRKLYTDVNLKPEDKLTIMFSFKNLGSYKSTNLAVSETDKQDVEWDTGKLKNEFYK